MIKQRPYVRQRSRETKRIQSKIPQKNRYYVIDLLDIRKPQAWKFDFFNQDQAWNKVSKIYPNDENFFQVWSGIKLNNNLDTIIFYRTPETKEVTNLYDYPAECKTSRQRESFRNRIHQKNKRERERDKKDQCRRKAKRTKRRQRQRRDILELAK